MTPTKLAKKLPGWRFLPSADGDAFMVIHGEDSTIVHADVQDNNGAEGEMLYQLVRALLEMK